MHAIIGGTFISKKINSGSLSIKPSKDKTVHEIKLVDSAGQIQANTLLTLSELTHLGDAIQHYLNKTAVGINSTEEGKGENGGSEI